MNSYDREKMNQAFAGVRLEGVLERIASALEKIAERLAPPEEQKIPRGEIRPGTVIGEPPFGTIGDSIPVDRVSGYNGGLGSTGEAAR